MTEPMSYNVTEAHIVQKPGYSGGEPHIAGHRIKVRHVYVWYELMGMTPDEIASSHDLTLTQVHAALAYAYEHIEAIQQAIREADAFVEEMKKEYQSKLKPLLEDE
jgi:uncharacterized protein (DUF433 family)